VQTPVELIALPRPVPRTGRRHRAAWRAAASWLGLAAALSGLVAAGAAWAQRSEPASGSPAGSAPAAAAAAAAAASAPLPLRAATVLQTAPDPARARERPIVLLAREVEGQAERALTARGAVELRRAGLVIEADWLRYDVQQDMAEASGHVRVQRDGTVFSGPQAQLHLQRFEGWFLQPRFDLLPADAEGSTAGGVRAGAGGRAERLDFLGERRFGATAVQYTSCPRDGSADPAWLLAARRVEFDYARNEGIAEGAVLRFLGVPILALPRMSFPITGARKSGWLPPSLNLDNRSGVDLSVPWYWNLAPNRDATLAPRLSTRRGAGLDAEFRYLEPAYNGELALRWLPHDQVAGTGRHALKWRHEAEASVWPGRGELASRLQFSGERVSDDDWWRDFPRATSALTPRLLPLQAGWEQPLQGSGVEGLAYLRTTRWQVMQTLEAPIAVPYDRALQVGALWSGAWGGWATRGEAELNRFTLAEAAAGRPTGWRTHALLGVSRPWREPGFWVVPRLGLNAAAYDLDQPLADGRRRLARTIPTASLDLGVELERDWEGFGRRWRQTLEPRVLAVYTPWREQVAALSFDSAGKDFGFSSLFSDNDFSGIDRVSDARQVNLGLTTRLVDAQGGRELLRLGAVQRYLLADQLITVEGAPFTRRFSDFILVGSTTAVPNWALEGSMRYNADIRRPVRSLLSARWQPGEFRTLSATYRFARGSSEQLELGWQWPLGRLGALPVELGARSAAPSRCSGQLYGVGRVNYSVRDSRVTDSILGLEFDAGCWIGRVVIERLSTGRTEATTRLMLQLELVGLSPLGSNPLRVLKDNIPGYQLLREPRGAPSSPTDLP
jgi:LPS-assembly protein